MSKRSTLSIGDKQPKPAAQATGDPNHPTNGRRLSLEQQRAQHAWEKAGDGVQKFKKDYANVAKAVPGLIMNTGLMQVLAFLNGKDSQHRLLAEHLHDWLHHQHQLPKDFKPCMEALMQSEPREFQLVTAEALVWLKWLRQMADARMGEEG
ncbi:type III-B CRISPR module-associated protein Cmr5 [Thioalkalivibrio sp. ALE11]|uniref:type III-B CRISPR module-associated protein Cmr5 n=1 Tax=Thioalkalivibrio sp. ALE11 TaxID=1265494 RepID=UPI00037E865E|nr:type III-B CRISPR module-associated protein Cmr5 [Thioalkalivibrio sp. ALE11]